MPTERSIVKQLITHLKARGFTAVAVDNGEEVIWNTSPINTAALLEDVFSVDESNLMFRAGPAEQPYAVFLVQGEGEDIITDWGIDRGDSPWNDAMDSFNHSGA